MACCANSCCSDMMCANAGGNLDNVFNDIGQLLNPFTPAINKKIACSGKPQTLIGKLGITSGQFVFFGIAVVAALILLPHVVK